MPRKIRLALAFGFTILLVGGPLTGIGLAQSADISMTVDGESAGENEAVMLKTNPEVGLEVAADQPIQSVEVRVNGDVKKAFTPDATTLSQTFDLELEDGENHIQVVVSAGDVSTYTTTIVKDSVQPRVAFTSPFTTGQYEGIPESPTVHDAKVDLAGTLFDDTAVRSIHITHTYRYSVTGQSGQKNVEYTIDDPGDSFSQPLFLGHGDNSITLKLTDELGNMRRYSFDLRVEDTEEPTLSMQIPSRSGASELQVRGTVSDNVKVDEVTIVRPDGAAAIPVHQTDPKPEENRLEVPISQKISLREGQNTITVRATDIAGNTLERDFQIEYDPNVAPRITVLRSAPAASSEAIRLRARVDRNTVKTVSVETVNPRSGEIIDHVLAYTGDGTNRVDINTTLSLASGETRLRILAVSPDDEQYEKSITVSADGAVVGSDDSAGPDSSTATPTERQDEGVTASSGDDRATTRSLRMPTLRVPGFTIPAVVVALLGVAIFVLRTGN